MSDYNQILYPTHVHLETHPDTLARTAILFGMDPPPVDRCRVLEIACGDGGNLIPMGFELPHSGFVGIDSASLPIQHAQQVIERCGLKNVAVHAMDLMEFGPDFGKFDYIIAHGIYSWVPAAVQEKILHVCRDHLSPSGVAFISFNTGPASRIRQLTRDMMKFHLRAAGIESDTVREGRKFLDELVGLVDDSSIWKAVLWEESVRLSKRPENVTFHDELGSEYSPAYFSDFVAAAECNGLQFLSDTNLGDALEPAIKPEAAEAIERLAQGDVIKRQQYLDFVTFRGFRRTLLCHSGIPLERTNVLARVPALRIASPLAKSSVEPDGGVVFTRRRSSASVTTNSPIMSLALERLETIWPRAESFATLASEIAAQVPQEQREQVPAVLAQGLLKMAANKLVDLRTYDAPVAESIGERPLVTRLARLQAAETTLITTLLHTQIEVADPRTRHLLQLLDGTRDLQDLIAAMMAETGMSRESTENNVHGALEVFRTTGLLAQS